MNGRATRNAPGCFKEHNPKLRFRYGPAEEEGDPLDAKAEPRAARPGRKPQRVIRVGSPRATAVKRAGGFV